MVYSREGEILKIEIFPYFFFLNYFKYYFSLLDFKALPLLASMVS
jgi:hypothetical protein